MNYLFTVAKTGQREPFHQICRCLKTICTFIQTCSSSGHDVYQEHGVESVHKISRLLQRTYCSMQPATLRLQSMLKKEHHRLVHLDSKALEPVILKRKWHPKGKKIHSYHKSICLNLLYKPNIWLLLR